MFEVLLQYHLFFMWQMFIACYYMPGTVQGAWETLVYLLVRIVLVAGDKNAAQMDLSQKKKKEKKLLKSPEASGQAGLDPGA